MAISLYLRDKIDMAVRLFDALKAEAQSLRLVIQEATSSLAGAYKVCSGMLDRLKVSFSVFFLSGENLILNVLIVGMV